MDDKTLECIKELTETAKHLSLIPSEKLYNERQANFCLVIIILSLVIVFGSYLFYAKYQEYNYQGYPSIENNNQTTVEGGDK